MGPSLSWPVKEHLLRTQGLDVSLVMIFICYNKHVCHSTDFTLWPFPFPNSESTIFALLCLPNFFFSLATGIATRSRNSEFLTVKSLKLGMETQSHSYFAVWNSLGSMVFSQVTLPDSLVRQWYPMCSTNCQGNEKIHPPECRLSLVGDKQIKQ